MIVATDLDERFSLLEDVKNCDSSVDFESAHSRNVRICDSSDESDEMLNFIPFYSFSFYRCRVRFVDIYIVCRFTNSQKYLLSA